MTSLQGVVTSHEHLSLTSLHLPDTVVALPPLLPVRQLTEAHHGPRPRPRPAIAVFPHILLELEDVRLERGQVGPGLHYFIAAMQGEP